MERRILRAACGRESRGSVTRILVSRIRPSREDGLIGGEIHLSSPLLKVRQDRVPGEFLLLAFLLEGELQVPDVFGAGVEIREKSPVRCGRGILLPLYFLSPAMRGALPAVRVLSELKSG